MPPSACAQHGVCASCNYTCNKLRSVLARSGSVALHRVYCASTVHAASTGAAAVINAGVGSQLAGLHVSCVIAPSLIGPSGLVARAHIVCSPGLRCTLYGV